MFALVPFVPCVLWANVEPCVCILPTQVVCITTEKYKVRKPQSFKESARNLPNVYPEGTDYLYYPGQQSNLLSAPQEETIPIFSLENVVQKNTAE